MIILVFIIFAPVILSSILITYLVYRKFLRTREKWLKIVGTVCTFLVAVPIFYFILEFAGYFDQFQR